MKHFKKTIREDDETEAVILLDASKAFDQLHACSPQPANEGYVHNSLPFSLATKKISWIILKSEALLELTKNAFTGTGIKTTTEGKRLLVSSLGSDTFREKYASDKVKNWRDKIERLLHLPNSSHK